MLDPLIAGVTTGTPIKVEVPNTDQRGHVSGYPCLSVHESSIC